MKNFNDDTLKMFEEWKLLYLLYLWSRVYESKRDK